MLSSAQRYLAAVIAEGRVETLLKHGPVAHLFAGHEERLWSYFDRHVKTYGTLPDFALVKADTGFDLAAQTQPAAFYLDRARDNHLHRSLLALLAEVHHKHLAGANANPREAPAWRVAQLTALLTARWSASGLQTVLYAPSLADAGREYGGFVAELLRNHYLEVAI